MVVQLRPSVDNQSTDGTPIVETKGARAGEDHKAARREEVEDQEIGSLPPNQNS